ncbi:MAG: hypothetical protein H7335_22590 [Massilia sp.]|nr:hypothetical protein [Massilia sp.]
MDSRIVKHTCTAVAVAMEHMGTWAPQARLADAPAAPRTPLPHDFATFFLQRFFAVPPVHVHAGVRQSGRVVAQRAAGTPMRGTLPARAQRLGGAQA